VNFLGSVLYGISPRDPSTFAIVPFILTLVALLACWLPGRRATLIEPNAALRAE
jgi:ABC-type lipoprotein release transport system permease subunit